MEPLSAAVVTVVTKFILDTSGSVGRELGEKAATAARSLAQAVLARLGNDPAEAKTVERYRSNPEAMQPAVVAALDEAVASDEGFAAELQKLLDEFKEAAGPGIRIDKVDGSVQFGNNNVQIDRTTGNITLNQPPER